MRNFLLLLYMYCVTLVEFATYNINSTVYDIKLIICIFNKINFNCKIHLQRHSELEYKTDINWVTKYSFSFFKFFAHNMFRWQFAAKWFAILFGKQIINRFHRYNNKNYLWNFINNSYFTEQYVKVYFSTRQIIKVAKYI